MYKNVKRISFFVKLIYKNVKRISFFVKIFTFFIISKRQLLGHLIFFAFCYKNQVYKECKNNYEKCRTYMQFCKKNVQKCKYFYIFYYSFYKRNDTKSLKCRRSANAGIKPCHGLFFLIPVNRNSKNIDRFSSKLDRFSFIV